MLSTLGGGGGKPAKPSFVSYVTPEEINQTEKECSRKEKHPDLLPGEVIFCSAGPVLKSIKDDLFQRVVYGTLLCTNFRVSFISDEAPSDEEAAQLFKNKLYGENDIPLTCVDHIYGGFDDKKKLIISGFVKNKYPSKIIVCCKDLRLFHFSLAYAKEEDAKKIFQGIVYHCLEPKSLKCVFAFSYGEKTLLNKENQTKPKTVMFDTSEDWAQEIKRTKGNCKLISNNADFSISAKLPQFFIVPTHVTQEDLTKFDGKGIPIWCWSHHSGCALFKTASLPLMQEDASSQLYKSYMEGMLNAVAQTHLYSVKTEELSDSLPTVQDIQQSYSKFKQFFLLDNTNDFWMTDVKWFSSLEGSCWLDIIRQCLAKAVEVVECLEKENTNVLIMEEEGSDLCCVISSLVQLMFDPYYRTLGGFQSLIQKEWVMGGHRFLDRCNHLHLKDKEQSQAPVFLLFLESVWQLQQQYPPAFQFSETYLTVLSDSIDVSVFSTFLFNSPHHMASIAKAMLEPGQRSPVNWPTVWDWSVQFDSRAQDFFINPLYMERSRQDKAPRKMPRPKHQRHQSLPSSAFKFSPSAKKGFLKDETDSLKKMLRVKRLSRWMNSPDSAQASTREFFVAWQRRPLDYHGLLLPCLEGPTLRLWSQRYLRWIPEAQIFGGGSITILKKLADLLAEVQDLRGNLDRQACRADFNHQGVVARAKSSIQLSSAFPFTMPRSRSFKPAIPIGPLHSLITDSLADQEDEENLGIV
ncbi:myotubularin-related protein 12 [Paramormyrops kingsleyae]|uniref:Myotubularin-related protein 12 n=1 Tax=Paramormyrops kingsleyae TaxID=1676925 RepID=A0A3B3S2A1_9TELE|nr:myotubularin-related protein 12 [Paramormyrops kingsleyae]